jgi:hypothetical protein
MVKKTDTTDGGVGQYKPMSVQVPTLEEEIEALKLRIAVLEHNCKVSHGARQPYVPRSVS